MKKWNLIVDVGRCHNSNNCFLSVADEYAGNDHPGYSAEMPLHGHYWIDILKKERGQAPMVDVSYAPTTCQHCDDAPCIEAATGDAIQKRPDGIVIIDPEKSKGQKQIVDACPYGAVWWNEEKEIPQAWPFDAHLLDRGWKEPRCVQACPTGALKSVKIEDADMAKMVIDEDLQVLNPEHATKPRVYYKNLDRFTKCFIGGTLAVDIDGVEECLEGAIIVLSSGGEKRAETLSDNYGDFKFDGLADGAPYHLEIMHADYQTHEVNVELAESSYLGAIKLALRG
jgi:Fe-S-cluster-containing dehydrogenase component